MLGQFRQLHRELAQPSLRRALDHLRDMQRDLVVQTTSGGWIGQKPEWVVSQVWAGDLRGLHRVALLAQAARLAAGIIRPAANQTAAWLG